MKVEINPYNPDWEKQFKNYSKLIFDTLKDFEPIIEHIGSTSVKGLGAKPIIDIMVGFKNETELNLIAENMINSGFTYYRIYDVLMPERRLFVLLNNQYETLKYFDEGDKNPIEKGFIPIVNCHCTILNNAFWKRHIGFRDYLRNNDDLRNQYHELKKQLSKKEWESLGDYTDAKSDFIKSVEKLL